MPNFPSKFRYTKKNSSSHQTSTHVWSTKRRWNQKLIVQFSCTLRDESFKQLMFDKNSQIRTKCYSEKSFTLDLPIWPTKHGLRLQYSKMCLTWSLIPLILIFSWFTVLNVCFSLIFCLIFSWFIPYLTLFFCCRLTALLTDVARLSECRREAVDW